MERPPLLDAAIAEMGRLGVAAVSVVYDGHWGVMVGEATFTAGREILEDEEDALDWALHVATLAKGAKA